MHPAPGPCPDKDSLLADLRAAIQQLNSFHSRELEAVARADPAEMERIDRELKEAQKWHDTLLSEYRRHVAEHGC